MLLVDSGPCAHLDLMAEGIGKRRQGFCLASEQLLGDSRSHREGHPSVVEARQGVANFAEQVVGHRLVGEQVAPALAVDAGFAERLDEIFPGSLSGHFDQTEFGDLEDIGSRLVVAQGIAQGSVGFFAMIRRLHVDQIDNDQAADIAEAELVDHLLDGFEIRFVDRLLEVALADEASGVDIDGGERLALIDDQRATGFEPYLALEVGVDLRLEPHLSEEGFEPVVLVHLGLRVGNELIDEFLEGFVGLGFVDDDSLRLGSGRVPHDSQGKVGLGVKDAWRSLSRVGELDRLPDGLQIMNIGFQVGFPHAVAGRANDETQLLGPQALDDFAQSFAFPIGIDAAGHADSGRPGRQDEVAAGNGNIGGDASALGPDGGLGDLHDDFLAFGKDSVDPRGRSAASAPALSSASAGAGFLLAPDIVEVVAHVEEGGFFEANVDKGRLHPREYPADATLDHVSDDALSAPAFDVEFRELGLFE